MYYGLFTKDLKAISLGESSLEACRRYLRKGYVICTEKEITTGFEINIQFHKRPRWNWHKWEVKKDIGFVSFEVRKLKYYWADKIVEEYNESEVAKNGKKTYEEYVEYMKKAIMKATKGEIEVKEANA